MSPSSAPFPATVPATAATPLPIDARLVFSDGAPGPAEPLVVTVRKVVGATIAPLGADGVATVNLAATVTPLVGAVEVGFQVEARAPTLLHLSTRRDIVAEVPSFMLTVNVSESGTVSSAPPGIACHGTCQVTYLDGTQVTLFAQADSGFTFTGWSGEACAGTGTCVVTMTANRTVVAIFALAGDGCPPPHTNCL